MAIKFKCKQCKTELNVKDEMAGKQGKCPKCKAVMTVPSAAVAEVPVKKKVVEDDVVAAEIVEEDDVVNPVEEVDEDEAPRRKKKPVSRRDDDEEAERPRRKSRRDDDDDDDDDDRPRRKRRRDDEEDEEEEDDERSRKKREKARRIGWERAARGVFLFALGHWLFVGTFALLALTSMFTLIATASALPSSPEGFTQEKLERAFKFLKFIDGLGKVMVYVSLLPLLASQILPVVGFAFTVTTPGKNGEKGLGIATLAVAGTSLLFFIFALIKVFDMLVPGMGAAAPTLLSQVLTNPFLGLEVRSSDLGEGPRGARLGDFGFIAFLLPLLVVGWLTMSNWYLFAVGKTLKDRDMSRKGFLMGIILPSVIVGMGLLIYLIGLASKSKSPAVGIVFLFLYYAPIVGILTWDALVKWQAKSTLEP